MLAKDDAAALAKIRGEVARVLQGVPDAALTGLPIQSAGPRKAPSTHLFQNAPMAKNIKPRSEDYAQWYLDVIKAAQLADYSPVKGCMVIRPEGSPSGRRSSAISIGGSRRPATSTPISRC